jgi:hypothetical protein
MDRFCMLFVLHQSILHTAVKKAFNDFFNTELPFFMFSELPYTLIFL